MYLHIEYILESVFAVGQSISLLENCSLSGSDPEG
jgi:hypothetical protein